MLVILDNVKTGEDSIHVAPCEDGGKDAIHVGERTWKPILTHSKIEPPEEGESIKLELTPSAKQIVGNTKISVSVDSLRWARLAIASGTKKEIEDSRILGGESFCQYYVGKLLNECGLSLPPPGDTVEFWLGVKQIKRK